MFVDLLSATPNPYTEPTVEHDILEVAVKAYLSSSSDTCQRCFKHLGGREYGYSVAQGPSKLSIREKRITNMGGNSYLLQK